MSEFEQFFCPNNQCKDYGLRRQGNIAVRGKYETLSRGKDRIFRPKTPAMAASVADHLWTFSELLAYPALCQ